MRLYVAAKNWLNDYVKPLSIETSESRQTLSNFVYFIWGIRREGWGRGRKKGRDRERE